MLMLIYSKSYNVRMHKPKAVEAHAGEWLVGRCGMHVSRGVCHAGLGRASSWPGGGRDSMNKKNQQLGEHLQCEATNALTTL